MTQANLPTPSTTTVRALRQQARRGTFPRLISKPLGLTSLLLLTALIALSLAAPVLAPYSPNATDLANVFAESSPTHLLGTDSAGRDVFSRLLYGGQATFGAAALATIVALLVGVPSGLVAGFYGRWFDSVASWVSSALLALPAIVVLLAARASFGPSVWISMTIFGVLFSPSFFRLVRTAVRSVSKELYVDAARVSGLSDARIIGRHILSVVRAPIIIQAAVIAGIAIAVQAGLEFLGLGDLSVPTWGMMLNEGFRNVFVAPLFVVWPALAISLATASLVLLGNALRDALEDGDGPPHVRTRRPPRTDSSTSVAPRTSTLLEVTDLTIGYPQRNGDVRAVVQGVTFSVDAGEVVGIVGESGSGKSQTAFALLGLLPRNALIMSGDVHFSGQPLIVNGVFASKEISTLRGRRIAYVPQEPMTNLDPNFTIGHQLTRPLVARLGVTSEVAKSRALELLRVVGIADPERTMRLYPHEISGGMAQRVLIAGAVSCEPDLLIADEPTTALDVTVQAEVLDLLRDLRERMGMAVLIVTHNFGVVADLCDRVVVMNRSRVVEQGETRTILRAPGEDYTRRLLDSTLQDKQPRTLLLAGGPDHA